MLRRMSLTGDAMAHAILPGAAIGYLVAGLSLPAMTFGGVVAGLLVTLTAAFVARSSRQSEDSSLAAFYLLSLSVGVVIVSTSGSSVDLLHVLFGSVLALDDAALFLLGAIASISLVVLAILYRPLVFECVNMTKQRRLSSRPRRIRFQALARADIRPADDFSKSARVLLDRAIEPTLSSLHITARALTPDRRSAISSDCRRIFRRVSSPPELRYDDIADVTTDAQRDSFSRNVVARPTILGPTNAKRNVDGT